MYIDRRLDRRADLLKLNSLSKERGVFVCMDGLNWGLQATDKIVSENHFVPILNLTLDQDMMANIDVVINGKGDIARFHLTMQDCSIIAPDYKISSDDNKLFLQSLSDDKETIRLICKWNKDMTDILRSRFVQVKDIAISLWDFYLETNKEN